MNKKILPFCFFCALAAGNILFAANARAALDAPIIPANLAVGSVGEDVRNLQRFLNAAGFTVSLGGPGSPGNETATFGGATRAALARFQSANGIAATGAFDNRTRILLAVLNLKNQIAFLQQQLAAMLADTNQNNNSNAVGDTSGPHIATLKINNGGDSGYVDTGDYITIIFNEAINPRSINSGLAAGDRVTGVAYYETGGVSVSSDGKVVIKNIAEFDMGSVRNAGTFAVELALDPDGKILTVTLSGGGDLDIADENFGRIAQSGGTVYDKHGNKMTADSDAGGGAGTFGGKNTSGGASSPYITSIAVFNGGDNGYIDKGDYIEITFNKAIDPKSINADLANGGTVVNLYSSDIGGVSVSSDGRVNIGAIASFDSGTVKTAGNFTSKVLLNSTGRVLTVTLTGGNDVEITSEDFDSAAQIAGAIEDTYGNVMQGDQNMDDPYGTFGGNNDGPNIASISVYNGGIAGYIDEGDYINITFTKAIDPSSINGSLSRNDTVDNIGYSQTGGMAVSSSGTVTVRNIAVFDMGSVYESQNYTVDLALNSGGDVLTIILTGGNSNEITHETLDNAIQIGGTVTDEDGNVMNDGSSIANPSGTFGGEL